MDNNLFTHIPEDIQLLMAERASGKLAEQSAEKLQQWLIENPDFIDEAAQFEAMITALIVHRKQKDVNTLKAYKKLLERRRNHQKVRLIRWLSYAASILIIAATAWYFSVSTQDVLPEKASVSKHPAGKRSEKAMLVLADGSTLFLDADSTISLHEKAGLNIENQSGGKLSYQAGGPAEASALTHQLIIPAGARYQLQLSDGTHVWLNAATTLEYPLVFGEGKRRVKLDGEAYFDVQPDNRPFEIEVNGSVVTVHGTSFNISSYQEDGITATTLISGSVSFTDQKGATKKLVPGDQLRLHHESNTVEIEQVDTKLYVSWKEGVLYFQKIPLHELTKKLSRWYDVEFVFENSAKAEILFSGAIENSRELDFLLRLISKSAPLTFETNGRTVLIK